LIPAGSLLPLRFRWFWLGVGVMALMVGLSLALAPLVAPLPPISDDKTLHFLGFVLLTTWFLGIFESHVSWRIAAALAAYGVLIEVLQGFTAYRFSDPYDVLANVAGIGTGWLLSAAGLRHWCRRVETLLGAGT
jgi:VanZ family protein